MPVHTGAHFSPWVQIRPRWLDRIYPDIIEPNETQKNSLDCILLTETVPFLGLKPVFLIYSVSQLSANGWGKTLTAHYKFKSNAIYFVLSFFSIQDHILLKTNCVRNVDITMNGCLWQRMKYINFNISLVLKHALSSVSATMYLPCNLPISETTILFILWN